MWDTWSCCPGRVAFLDSPCFAALCSCDALFGKIKRIYFPSGHCPLCLQMSPAQFSQGHWGEQLLCQYDHSRELQGGAQWAFPNQGNVTVRQKSCQEPTACAIEADGSRSNGNQDPLHIEEDLRECQWPGLLSTMWSNRARCISQGLAWQLHGRACRNGAVALPAWTGSSGIN